MKPPSTPAAFSTDRLIRVMSYNVHSCVGTDRRLDADRVADVIAASSPDVIALQELDVGRMRTGQVDQAEYIAERLRMVSHFHPAMHVEEEKYGDAIITALPSRLRQVFSLPSRGEPRGALWVEIDCGDQKLQIVNTHLGLGAGERVRQVDTLFDMIGNSVLWKHDPALLVGDFNAVPWSRAYKCVLRHMPSSRLPAKASFPSIFPLLRLDHVFANAHARLVGVETVDTPLARRASDHLPVIATVALGVSDQTVRQLRTDQLHAITAAFCNRGICMVSSFRNGLPAHRPRRLNWEQSALQNV